MTQNVESVLRRLVAAARAFEIESFERAADVPNLCSEDPCPYCTAGVELQGAYLDAEDYLDALQNNGTVSE